MTVGRLQECVDREYINLAECDCLIIDEADKFPAKDSDLSKIQTKICGFKAAFSATYSNVDSMFNSGEYLMIDCTESSNPEDDVVSKQLPHIETVDMQIGSSTSVQDSLQ